MQTVSNPCRLVSKCPEPLQAPQSSHTVMGDVSPGRAAWMFPPQVPLSVGGWACGASSPPLLFLPRGRCCVVPRGGSFAPAWLYLQNTSAVCPVQHHFNAQWPSFNSQPCTARQDSFRVGWHGLPCLWLKVKVSLPVGADTKSYL